VNDQSDGSSSGGPSDQRREPFDLTSDADFDIEEEARRLVADLDAATGVADAIDLSAEEAVAEAVEIAQKVEAERDELRDLLQRVQADFANYKRRVDSQREEQRGAAAADLVRELLPVLDAGEAAITQGLDAVEPLHSQLLGTLEKLGLERVAQAGVVFDPSVHEAVMHDQSDQHDGEPEVAEVLRSGYLWNTRVIRPAMVRVVG